MVTSNAKSHNSRERELVRVMGWFGASPRADASVLGSGGGSRSALRHRFPPGLSSGGKWGASLDRRGESERPYGGAVGCLRDRERGEGAPGGASRLGAAQAGGAPDAGTQRAVSRSR